MILRETINTKVLIYCGEIFKKKIERKRNYLFCACACCSK
jgi:hypothetical protein